MKKTGYYLVCFFCPHWYASHPDVEQIGPETFWLSRHADTDYYGLSILGDKALEEPYRYCSRQNWFMRVDTITEFLPPGNTKGLLKKLRFSVCV